ncbi:MAG: hypothetical protein WDM89_21025 [Rhizomicrobium sp.]
MKNIGLELPEQRIVRVCGEQLLNLVERLVQLVCLEQKPGEMEPRGREARRQRDRLRKQFDRVRQLSAPHRRLREQADRIDIARIVRQMPPQFALGQVDPIAAQVRRSLREALTERPFGIEPPCRQRKASGAA